MLKIRLLSVFVATIMLLCSATAEIKSPKNIIIMIGDGMSYNTVTATNYYVNGKDSVSYQYFPVKYACSTYNGMEKQEYRADSAWLNFDWVRTAGKYTDSAPAATALSTGKKSYDGAIGVDMKQQSLEHIMTFAKSKGKAAGVVSSVQFAHATPAGFVAHNINRNNYSAIATEMLNSNIDVIIGAGNPDYTDNATIKTGTKDYKYVGDQATWESLKAGTLGTWSFSDDSTRIAEIAKGVNVPNRLCAVPKVATTLQQARTVVNGQTPFADAFNKKVNNLSQLSLAAMNVLNKNSNGFVAMIEGGAIDWANHGNQKGRMIEEQIDFNNAVDSVIAWVQKNGGWENNLLIVTSDHECGYLLGPNDTDNKPTTNPIVNNGIGAVPGMKYNSGSHTNMLTPLFAKGAGAEMFSLHADREDPIRGYYVDNTEVAKTCYTLIKDVPASKGIKNVIYMISDGWGANHIKAANYYEGKTQGFESFPTSTYMTSYHGMGVKGSTNISEYFTSYNSYKAWNDSSYINVKPTDSAPAGTAMGTGVKVFDGSINKSNQQLSVKTLAEIAKQKGKAAGVVSSVQISHATPAAFGGAHNLSRNNYAEIANEMLSSNLDVIIGAGHPEFDDNGSPKTTGKEFKYVGGETTWNSLKTNTLNNWSFSDDKSRLAEIATGTNVPSKLCFVARAATTLQQMRTGDAQVINTANMNTSVPNLVAMTKASLNVLSKNTNGFFVMIEGGAVDWAGHGNQKGRVIEEQMDFNRSVEAVIDWVETNSNWNETLVIVTGDHETGYLSGPTYRDLGKCPIIDNGVGNIPAMAFYSGNHTAQLIPFYAKGSNADVLARMAGCYDTKKEYYIENTDAAILVKSIWGQLADCDIISSIDYSPLYTNKEFIVVTKGKEAQLICNDIDGNATIQFINLSGKVTDRANCNFNKGTANVQAISLHKGVNFALLTKDNKKYISKFIVE